MAVVINLSDPGAVPGASTDAAAREPEIASVSRLHRWGRNRIDEGVKGVFLLGMVPPLSGHLIVANDNYAPVAQAA